MLRPPASVGAELVRTDRGGDVTYHGPGQLVGYPIVTLPEWRDGMRDVVAYVRRLEAVLIGVLDEFGVPAGRRERLTGVWVGDEKVAAIGVKVAQGRTRHGFALNVDPDLSMFDHIVPCGIRDKGVTSMRRLLGAAAPSMGDVADVFATRFAAEFGYADVERQDVAWGRSVLAVHRGAGIDERLRTAAKGRCGCSGGWPTRGSRRPRRTRRSGDPSGCACGPISATGYRETKRLMRSLSLHTVCEEAGCPNIYECWADPHGHVHDPRRPLHAGVRLLPRRHAQAAARSTSRSRRASPTRSPRCAWSTSWSPASPATTSRRRCVGVRGHDPCRPHAHAGDPGRGADPRLQGRRRTRSDVIFDARPDVLNHNLETVARLQRAARPSAAYARSLAVLARAKGAGLVTKSGLILGMGETEAEVRGAIADLRAVGVDILTLGQYLRPSTRHLPVVRWWHPDEFAALGAFAESLGFAHVEAGPLVRSSYHAKRAVDAATPTDALTIHKAVSA